MSRITTRRHHVMTVREQQLNLNELAVNGGRAYIDARLWRAPNETDVSWLGDGERGIVGRKAKTALVNDAGRIAAKINQYIFRKDAVRNGADAAFMANCTGNGESVTRFMERVNTSITFGRWCWLQADRPPLADGASETLADKARVTWRLWDAIDVPDWCVGPDGEIKWLITRSSVYLNDNPWVEAVSAKLYTLYERREDGVYVTEECDTLTTIPLRCEVKVPGLERIPFLLVGKPSEDAWWFDDVENIQAQILNLDSMHNETLSETVYPQLVVPGSVANSLEIRLAEQNVDGKQVAALIRELTLGRKIPLLEAAEDKGISRYIAPSGDLKMLVEEGARKRALVFDTAGLAMFNRETRQVQTAEAKAFDMLDTNATLGNRAMMLQDAEKALVEISRMFDPAFPAYDPVYPSTFDVVDVSTLAQALTQAANMPNKTPKVMKIEAKAALRVLKEVAAGIATDEEFEEALEEIDATDFEVRTALPDPFAGMPADDDDDGEGIGADGKDDLGGV